MNKNKKTVFVVDDDYTEFSGKLLDYFKESDITFTFFHDLSSALKNLTFYDKPDLGAILLDIQFFGDPRAGLKKLPYFRKIDPEIPILMLTALEDPDSELGFYSGAYGSQKFLKKQKYIYGTGSLGRLQEVLNSCIFWQPSYDKEQQDFSNDVAGQYMDQEQECPGTVAFWLYEDKILIDTVRDFLYPPKETETIKILDIGCGTGRIESVLWTAFENEIKNGKLILYGLDFSGGMLKVAKQKLEDLTKKNVGILFDEQKPINICRGIAEELPFESEFFDIVIMGFGIISYSDHYRTLKEACRVLKKGGYFIGSGYNADAMYHSIRNSLIRQEKQLPLAMDIERKPVGPDKLIIKIFGKTKILDTTLFSPQEFSNILKYSGFQPIGKVVSFPFVCSFVPKHELQKGNLSHPIYNNAKLNTSFYDLDCRIVDNIPDKGVYLVCKSQKG